MKLKILTLASIATILFSCNQGAKKETSQNETSTTKEEVKQPVSHVMTKEEQAKLTPDEVFQQFVDGNKRFQSGTITARDHSEQARKSAPGQFPKAGGFGLGRRGKLGRGRGRARRLGRG